MRKDEARATNPGLDEHQRGDGSTARSEYLKQAAAYLLEGYGHVVPEKYLALLELLIVDALENRAIRRLRRVA